MYCAWFILYGQPDIYKKNKYLEEIYEVIVGIQKFINATKNYKGKSLVNSLEILDFEYNNIQMFNFPLNLKILNCCLNQIENLNCSII